MPSRICNLQISFSRLAATTWPDQIEGITEKWEQGTELNYIKSLVKYWQNDYNWRIHEEMLNSFPQFKTEIDGLDLHFLHIKSSRSDAQPLLLLHGWPGSFLEFIKLIPLLASTQNHIKIIKIILRSR
jgi:pimeloyl-ACP methyl ester carboxylesterase